MSVTFGGFESAGYGDAADKPTGLSDGDLWVIWVGGFYDATTTPATATGFTVISGAGFAGHPTDDRLSGTWLAKIVTNAASEPATVTITPGGGVGDAIPFSFYVRGASNVSVADAVAGVSSANTADGEATQVTLPSVSVGRDGSRAAIGLCAWSFNQWQTAGEPTGFDSPLSYSGSEVFVFVGNANIDTGANPAPTVQYTDGGGGLGTNTGDGLVAMVVFQPSATTPGAEPGASSQVPSLFFGLNF